MEEKRFVHLRNGKIYSTTRVGRESAADAATPPTTDHLLKTDLVLDTTSGRIVDVWSTDDSQQQPTSVALPPADDTRVIDLEGKLVLPEVGSMGELKEKLRAYVDAKRNAGELQPGRWVVGFGWDQDLMGHNGYPSRQDLDEVVPDVPVLLLRACLHIGVTNSAGLRAAGITRDTPSPPGGQIDKDPQGEPTGIVRELALDQVQRLIENDRETLKKYIETAIKYCVSVGLTAVHANDDAPAWQLYEELQQEGKLPIRVYLTVYHHELDRPDIPKPLSQTGLLECHRVKIIADGSLGAETAALRQPYVGKDAKGLLIYSRPTLVSMVKTAHDLGYRLEVHAIGDEAAEAVLEAFEKAGVRPEDRPILTHCQILGPDLLDTMARLGVIANVQPQFVTTDSLWLHKRVQPEVLPYCYAWKTMLDKGIRVAGGSDAPIELPDPFLGLYAAIFRHDTNKQTWREEERLTFDEALHIYTASGAFTAKREDELGSLERGKKADFVVVSHRVDLDPALLAHHGPDQVWVDGRLRWHSAMGREVGARGKTCSC